MLRCLGWQKSHIVFITFFKSTLFFIIPGAIAGLLFTRVGVEVVKAQVRIHTGVDMMLDFGWGALFVGIAVAIVLPFVAMIEPIY
mmetsp:Transcript_11015/g.16718  ORF Transcript_11015/g.16718 Transcript_11015/m.16718 type:complete len:85 (+) Transcript_11015:2453-2707(+)